MKYISVITLVASVLISSCNQQQSSTDKEEFEAYLKLKRVSLDDQTRYERLRVEYDRRAALAVATLNTELLDQVLIDAEIEEFRKELLISRYFEKYLNDAVTDQGIQNYYSNNVDDYKTRKAQVSHILFRVNPGMDETERQVALTKASEAHSKITSGEDFASVAKTMSEDKVSAAKGGSLGWINDGAISKAFSEKIFAMQKDQISEPFLTDYGFHIVKIDEGQQDVVKPLEALKGDIRYQLRSESKKAETKRLLESVSYLPEKAEVKK
ncbi:MAG: peptidylprolyl isomerase [Arenicella sp.]|nr:peptidylprolyl isomerase [Arenicella sp.]